MAWLSNKALSLKDTNILADTRTSCRFSFFENPAVNNNICDTINGYVNITEVKAGKITMNAQTTIPCILNLTQAYHHNWKVSTDGKPQQITKTNLAFMSIPLPAGSHTIIWQYNPGKIYFSMVVSFFAALFICIFISINKLRKIKPGRKHE